MPPVDMLPVSASFTVSPSAGTESRAWPWPARTSSAASSTLIRVSTFSCPTPRRGSAFVSSTSCSTVDVPSPVTEAGTRSAIAAIRPSMMRQR